MRLKINLLLLVVLFPTLSILGQESSTNTLKDQFIDVIEKSNRYQDYKVVKQFKLNALRKNVMDSIAAGEAKLQTAQGTISGQAAEISTLTQNVSKLQSELSISIEKEEGITLFGSIIKKATFKTIMWSIIGALILVVVFLLYKFKNSNAITKEANLKLAEIEGEFDSHRQKSLEREQQLRRKLQDELNKNKKA